MENLITNNGFVKLFRSILDWEWYDHPDVFRIYIHLLIKANYAPAKWRGIEIFEGEHITSISKLSKELLMTEFKVRESLLKLKNTSYIEVTSTNKFTRLKLLKSAVYNNSSDLNHKQIPYLTTNKSQSNLEQTTTNKKNKEKKEIEERKEFFKNEILKFSNAFSKVHINKFYDYWSTENRQTGLLKFEEEKNWNLEFKLKSWVLFPKFTEKLPLSKNRP
ncbi:hypothetical protein [Flavobacterium lacustre]|uniref:hypothetical protein n=1 Tax=Flavobacterium lacustre TaxID=3016339 RepID=UPI0022B62D5C|nr:hypothetical protein [Flavobacterium lacustre]